MATGLPAHRRAGHGSLRRAAGTAVILRAWPRQRHLPFLPRERIDELRDRRLRATVRHAVRHVPHYAGLDPARIRGVGDLESLPLVSRADLLVEPAAFRSPAVAAERSLVVRTSGTTGEPLDVLHDAPSALRNIAYSERERAVDAALLGRRGGYRVLALEYSLGTLLEVRAFYDAAAFRPRRPALTLVRSEDGVDAAVAAIGRLRPDVIVGAGSWVETVFAALATTNPPHLPGLVVYGGSAVSPEGRALIEDELGIPVVSRYNAGEAFKLGYTCELRDGFHLHEDLCHVELVDGSGAPTAEGEPGEVVISNLVNRGTVLLRYRLGDRARLTGEACACGRTSRRLVGLEGKRNVIVRLPDGSPLHARALWGVIKRFEGVRRFQLLQHDRSRFEVRLQTVDRATYDAIRPGVLGGLAALLPGCRVDATCHERLEAAPGERFEAIVGLAETRPTRGSAARGEPAVASRPAADAPPDRLAADNESDTQSEG